MPSIMRFFNTLTTGTAFPRVPLEMNPAIRKVHEWPGAGTYSSKFTLVCLCLYLSVRVAASAELKKFSHGETAETKKDS